MVWLARKGCLALMAVMVCLVGMVLPVPLVKPVNRVSVALPALWVL